MNVSISADSTCDLSQEIIEKYAIGTLPLYIVKGGESFRDGLEIVPSDIYEYIGSGKGTCSTAAVSVADYIEFFTEKLKTHDAVVHLTISSDMSACYQNACIAAEELGNVYPVDSRNLSTGIGQLAIEGALMARQDMSGLEIQQRLIEKREKLDMSFLIDTLDYLYKGGRCSSVAAMGANLLSLKPCIEVKNGNMGVGKKYRGAMVKCFARLVHDRIGGRDDIDRCRIFVTNSGGFTEEELHAIGAEVLKYQQFEEVLYTRAGCTVSTHCGPGALGISFFCK